MVYAPSSKTKCQTIYMADVLDLIFTTYNLKRIWEHLGHPQPLPAEEAFI